MNCGLTTIKQLIKLKPQYIYLYVFNVSSAVDLLLYVAVQVNSFTPKRQLKAFANNAASSETIRNALPPLDSALFTTFTLSFTKFPVGREMERSYFQHGIVDFVKYRQ